MAANAARAAGRRLRTIRNRATAAAPRAAATALARAGETAVKVTLTQRTHPKGTRTPSAPGEPPALISGNLRRGIYRIPAGAAGAGVASQVLACRVGYGSVHEFGPVTIRAKRFPQLGNPDVGFFGKQVTIPARPWMKPTVEALVATGTASRVCATAFAGALFR